jgi:hypothetical protein
MEIDDELFYISSNVPDMLDKRFSFRNMLEDDSDKYKNSDVQLGYMKGVNDVLNYIRWMANESNNEEERKVI